MILNILVLEPYHAISEIVDDMRSQCIVIRLHFMNAAIDFHRQTPFEAAKVGDKKIFAPIDFKGNGMLPEKLQSEQSAVSYNVPEFRFARRASFPEQA